jgi:hypothetical protein
VPENCCFNVYYHPSQDIVFLYKQVQVTEHSVMIMHFSPVLRRINGPTCIVCLAHYIKGSCGSVDEINGSSVGCYTILLTFR